MVKYSLLICLIFIAPHCVAADAPWVGNDLSGRPCINSESSEFGPFDYLNVTDRGKHLEVVEKYHFGKEVEALQIYKAREAPLNLQYTLSAWPNHHRALIAVTNYQLLFNSSLKKNPLKSPAECYFQRALNFSKNDGVAHLLFAKYLTKVKHFDLADSIYRKVLELMPENPAAHYNYGLYLFELKRFDEAKHHADLAKKYGHPSDKLLKKLK